MRSPRRSLIVAPPMPAERRSLRTRTASTCRRELPRRAMPGMSVSCSVPTTVPSASVATRRS
ncbi:hypothetical protein, partial [Clavibacter michiganensis]|uniref:hypothetical protein n=1 Tax=Clavibacter michiganensis TaxID=28447 RepID=UPI001C0EE1F8